MQGFKVIGTSLLIRLWFARLSKSHVAKLSAARVLASPVLEDVGRPVFGCYLVEGLAAVAALSNLPQ